jgi:hypothetical protein
MSLKIERSLPYLKILLNSKKVNSCKLLKSFPPFVTADLAKCLIKITRGKIKSKHAATRLRKHKKPLLKLINLRNDRDRIKFMHKQRGGFLGAVLPLAAGIISGIVANAI